MHFGVKTIKLQNDVHIAFFKFLAKTFRSWISIRASTMGAFSERSLDITFTLYIITEYQESIKTLSLLHRSGYFRDGFNADLGLKARS